MARLLLPGLCFSVASAALNITCHTYLGNIVDDNLGPASAGQVPADCCATCLATAGCNSWTFTSPGPAACYLHPTTGAGIDSSSSYISGTCGDDAIFDNPLLIADGPTRTGVPLGGIGAGFFDIALDGGISRIGINNHHEDGIVWGTNGSFLAVYRASAGGAHLLQRRPSIAGLPPAAHTTAAAAFPTINVTFDSGAVLRAWSPFVPHDVANSSLPLAVVEVTVPNAGVDDDTVAVAFSWQDVIARRLFDVNDTLLDRFYPTPVGSQPCGWETNVLRGALSNAGIDARSLFPRLPTTASPLSVPVPGAAAPLVGFEQHAASPLAPNKFTLQHYVHRLAVLAETQPGDEVTALPAYAVDAAPAAAAWAPFAAAGTFPTAAGGFPDTPLFAPGAPKEAASALAVRARVPAGGSRTFRFFVAWWGSEPAVAPGQDPRTWCGTGDYGRAYMAAFASLEAAVAHVAGARAELAAATTAWHAPLLGSSLPPWLAFKVINSAYTLFTNAILTRGGRFSMMEGGMGGLSGTMDQRIVAHVVYQKLFPSLDFEELAQFAAAQNADGSINHFDAHLYAGITGTDGASPLGGSEYNDNTVGWIYQVAKAYQLTGDARYITLHGPRLGPALAFLASLRTSPAFPALISGSNTYDDFWELPLDAYLCSVYPLALEAGRVIAAAAGNATLAAACARDRDAASAQNVAALFNSAGFFSYGAQLDGSGRADALVFGGQTAGQMLARHAGWGDVGAPFNATQSALAVQLARQVAPSFSFYAPKVWNLTSGGRAIDPGNGKPSSTWPFYLESYTALAAAQAGFVDDALSLLRNIQLVNARLGLTWCQDLWSPGSITYVAAPVSWFATDLLAGAALDVPGGTLWVSPFVRPGDDAPASWPVLLPGAWLVYAAARSPGGSPGGALTVTVLRTFDDVNGGAPVVVRRVAAAPLGTPAAAAVVVPLAAPWTVVQGAVLDLSAHFDALVAPAPRAPLLPPVAPQ